MTNVVHMADRKPIPPKTITDTHAGQRYVVTFDPKAPPHEQWVWVVDYVRVYSHYGASPTAEAAGVKARRLIHRMNQHKSAQEENE